MKFLYTPHFIKLYKKLDFELKTEVKEKIELFKQNIDHPFLKTHKLSGKLKGRFSFSVNYKTRIIFQYQNTNEIVFLAIGNHDVYNQ